MEVFFAFILPMILVLATVVFLRTCCERALGKPVPRLLCCALALLSLIPIGSWIALFLLIVAIWNNIADDDLTLKENRFTRYWFRS